MRPSAYLSSSKVQTLPFAVRCNQLLKVNLLCKQRICRSHHEQSLLTSSHLQLYHQFTFMSSGFPCCFFSLYFFSNQIFVWFPPPPSPPTNRLLIATNWFGEIITQNKPYVNFGLPSKMSSRVHYWTDRPSVHMSNHIFRKALQRGWSWASSVLFKHTHTVAFVFFNSPSLCRLPNRQVFPPNFCIHILLLTILAAGPGHNMNGIHGRRILE